MSGTEIDLSNLGDDLEKLLAAFEEPAAPKLPEKTTQEQHQHADEHGAVMVRCAAKMKLFFG